MKGWLKLLVLGAVPILAVTMVADQALAADKGSQLIFQANSDHTSFISVANANDGRGSDGAGSVLQRIHGAGYLVPESHHRRRELSGQPLQPHDSGHGYGGRHEAGTNVMEAIMGSGKASTHYVIAVTAVGANLEGLPAGTDQSRWQWIWSDGDQQAPIRGLRRMSSSPTIWSKIWTAPTTLTMAE